MIGEQFPSEKSTFRDPQTGAMITRYSSHRSINRTLYFTNRPFTHDGARMIFLSDRSGRNEMYSLEINTGKIVQLTDIGVAGNVSSCVHPTQPEIYFHTGQSIFRVNSDTLKTEELLRGPDGFRFGILNCTNTGRLAFEAVEQIPQGVTRVRNWPAEKPFQPSKPAGAESYYMLPKTLLYVYDIELDKLECVWGEHRQLTHTQISPTNKNLLIYSDFDGYFGAHRCYWLDLAAPRKRTPQPMFPETLHARGTHECFTRKGNVQIQWMEGDLQEGGTKKLFHAFRNIAGAPSNKIATSPFLKYELPEKRDYLWHHFTMSADETWGLHDRWLTAPNEVQNGQHLSIFRHQENDPQTIVEKVCFIGDNANDKIGLGPECHLDAHDEKAYFTGFLDGGAQLYSVDVRPFVDRLK